MENNKIGNRLKNWPKSRLKHQHTNESKQPCCCHLGNHCNLCYSRFYMTWNMFVENAAEYTIIFLAQPSSPVSSRFPIWWLQHMTCLLHDVQGTVTLRWTCVAWSNKKSFLKFSHDSIFHPICQLVSFRLLSNQNVLLRDLVFRLQAIAWK